MAGPAFDRFEIRAATPDHHAELLDLARHLNTVNLPDDPDALSALLESSERSFSGEIEDPARREYVFLLYDRVADRAVGTSMIIGQLGRRDAPYIYFDVRREEKYSATLDRHFVHTILHTTYSYDGPTELGGLVMHPDYRKRPERLGRLISYVRFLFIAMRRRDFRNELLAELLPPLRPDGTSDLWEAVGRRFTGLSYQHADKLSRRNKEFIRGLFPTAIYATLLDPEAQALVGQVGPQTRGVAKMLARIGFRYAERVDPFDGGPHFVAPTDDVSLVAAAAPVALTTLAGEAEMLPGSQPWMLARAYETRPYFVALCAPALRDSGGLQVLAEHAALRPQGSGALLWGVALPGPATGSSPPG